MEDPGFFAGLLAGLSAWFVFGTVTFWVILASVFGALVWITEAKRDFLAGVIAFAAIWLFAHANGISLLGDPSQLLKLIGAYLLIGAAWSFLKWISFLFGMKDKLKKLKADFVESKGVTLVDGKIPDSHQQGFLEYASRHHYNYGRSRSLREMSDLIPTVGDNVDSLTRWIVWWPLSAFWTILNDPLRRIADWIVRTFERVYTRIASSIFRSEI